MRAEDYRTLPTSSIVGHGGNAQRPHCIRAVSKGQHDLFFGLNVQGLSSKEAGKVPTEVPRSTYDAAAGVEEQPYPAASPIMALTVTPISEGEGMMRAPAWRRASVLAEAVAASPVITAPA